MSEIPPANACRKVVGKSEDVNVRVVDENMIREYQKAKYEGAKGQYRKAHRMFTSRRIMSVKIHKNSNSSSFVKAIILKSYTGNVSRAVAMLFNRNKPMKAFCP